MADLNYKAFSGIRWTGISTIFIAITQVISTAVLVRLLNPSDFGLMAIVMVVKGFADIFVNLGISVAILHYQNITENEYSSLYWFSMLSGIVLYGIVCGGCPFIAGFYNRPELLKLIPITCLVILFSSFGGQQRAFLQKRFHFKKIAFINIISSLLLLLNGLFFAYCGYGVYALVISYLIRDLFSNCAYFFIAKKYAHIKFHFSLFEIIPFLRIGGYNTVAQVINFFSSSFDVLIIGRFLGTDSVGIYNLAKDLVGKPSAILENIVLKVSIPVFSEVQDDFVKLKKIFFFMQKLVSTLNGFIYFGVFTLSPLIVLLYYGRQYAVCIPIIQVLAVHRFLRGYHDSMDTVCLAMGRTDIDVWWNFLLLVTTPFAIYIGVNISSYFVAISLLLSYTVLMYPNWYLYAHKLLNISFFSYYKTIFKTILLFSFPICCSLIMMKWVKLSDLSLFFISGLIFYGFSVFIYILFDREFLKIIIANIKKTCAEKLC